MVLTTTNSINEMWIDKLLSKGGAEVCTAEIKVYSFQETSYNQLVRTAIRLSLMIIDRMLECNKTLLTPSLTLGFIFTP